VWFTEQDAAKIGRITTSGAVSEDPIPTPPSEPIITPFEIVAGPDGALWFTDGAVLWRATTSGAFTKYSVGTAPFAYGITVGPDNALWLTEGSANAIGRLTTSGALRRIRFQPSTAVPWESPPGRTVRCGSPSSTSTRSDG
jgi:virginiamycin B lyase